MATLEKLEATSCEKCPVNSLPKHIIDKVVQIRTSYEEIQEHTRPDWDTLHDMCNKGNDPSGIITDKIFDCIEQRKMGNCPNADV